MTEQQHPITPPLELMAQWSDMWDKAKVKHVSHIEFVVTQAARWGADQELKAVCNYIAKEGKWFADPDYRLAELRIVRRPKPPSLAEQALDSWDRLRNETWCEEIDFDLNAVRAALERLKELEKNNE